ncbi:MAG: MYXO-CTERM domain-containing protein [Bradymonadia bacterium]
MKLALVVLLMTLAAPVANASECHIEGTFVGYQAGGEIGEFSFVIPVFVDATTDCVAPSTTMPSPFGRVWIEGTARFSLGESYRVSVRPGGTIGTHMVVSAVAAERRAGGVRIPATGSLLKPGQGPVCSQGAWRIEAMPVQLEVHQPGSDDVFTDRDLEAIERATTEWASPPCSAARFEVSYYADPVSRVEDGRNTIAFVEEGPEIFENLGPENLAFTCSVCDSEGYTIEADIRLNGIDRTWSTECNGVAYDIFGAVLHELGHALGLAHVEEPTSVMFGITTARRLLDAQLLTEEDVTTICQRYPCPEGEDCSEVSELSEACPAGNGLCATCTRDSQCGAETDRCLLDTQTGQSICARACSGSFPCPESFECVNTGELPMQCVPVDGFCPDVAAFVGCGCDVDGDCGGDADRCIGGRCMSSCAQSLSCPVESACTAVVDSEGQSLGELCVPTTEADPCAAPPAQRGCSRCSSSGGGGSGFLFLLAAMTLARRRVLVASRCA